MPSVSILPNPEDTRNLVLQALKGIRSKSCDLQAQSDGWNGISFTFGEKSERKSTWDKIMSSSDLWVDFMVSACDFWAKTWVGFQSSCQRGLQRDLDLQDSTFCFLGDSGIHRFYCHKRKHHIHQ